MSRSEHGSFGRSSPARRRAEAIIDAWDRLDSWESEVVADFALRETSTGGPIPPLTTLDVEADSWAALASIRELKTYIAAGIARLSPSDRASLSAYLRRLA